MLSVAACSWFVENSQWLVAGMQGCTLVKACAVGGVICAVGAGGVRCAVGAGGVICAVGAGGVICAVGAATYMADAWLSQAMHLSLHPPAILPWEFVCMP